MLTIPLEINKTARKGRRTDDLRQKAAKIFGRTGIIDTNRQKTGY